MSDGAQIEQRLVDTFLPLLPWTLQKAFGPVFLQDAWRAVALSFVPPSATVSKVILEETGDLASPALLSPSGRRRLRNRRKRFIRRQLQDNPLACAARDWFVQQRLGFEAAGYQPDPKRIRKLCDIEAETMAEFEAMAQKPEDIRETFRPQELGLGHRELEKLEAALGITVNRHGGRDDVDKYAQALIPHLMQMTFRPDTVDFGSRTRSSPLRKWIMFDDWPQTPDGIVDSMANLIIRLITYKNQRQIVAYGLARMMRQEYGLDRGRKVTTFSAIEEKRLREATQRGADNAPEPWEPEDLNAMRSYEDTDFRMIWQAIHDSAPPAQQEAMELYREAEETGRPLAELCGELGKDPNLVRNNYQALIRRVRRNSGHPNP